MSKKNKYRWFKCFFAYKDLIDSCSIFRTKKLITAMFDYASSGAIPKLDKKTLELFQQFKTVYDADREFCKKNGYRGSEKRWKMPDKRDFSIKNRESIPEK